MPIPIARANPRSAPELCDLFQIGPIPLLRPPQERSGCHENEEDEIAGSRNRASQRPALAADPQPAMHILDGGESSPQPGGPFAKDFPGVGIYEHGSFTSKVERHRSDRVRAYRNVGRRSS